MSDNTWIFYMPLIIFFIVLVAVSVTATYRQRAIQRRYLNNQMPVVTIQSPSQQQQAFSGQPVYATEMQYAPQTGPGYKYPNDPMYVQPMQVQPVQVHALPVQSDPTYGASTYNYNSSPIIR
jgi:hypothetical protein